MTIEAYRALNLSLDGSVSRLLLSQADREAKSGRIALTAEHEADHALPGLLTPAMKTWYRSEIEPYRSAALQEVLSACHAITLGKGQRGFLIENELGKLTATRNKQILDEREQFYNQKSIQKLSSDLEEKTRDYEDMRARNGGEDAHEWSKPLYFVLLCGLAAPEFPLNLESFMRINGVTPAIAVAITLCVALSIGVSSHIMGESLKQWSERFGGHVSRKERSKNLRFLSIGITLIFIAIGFVTWARWLLFQDVLQRKLLTGQGLDLSDYLTAVGSVAGNVLIWLLGTAFAFMAHSPIPDFGRKKRELQKLEAKLQKAHTRLLKDRVDRHLSRAQRDSELLRVRVSRELNNRPDYAAARARFEEMKAIDGRVLAILEAYRTLLLDRARDLGAEPVFSVDDLSLPTKSIARDIDGGAYEQKRLVLGYA